MCLSRTVSEINDDFSRKSQFFHPVHFTPPLKGLTLELGTVAGDTKKTRMMAPPGRERSLTISSAVWIQCTNATDRRADGRTPRDSKDRAYA